MRACLCRRSSQGFCQSRRSSAAWQSDGVDLGIAARCLLLDACAVRICSALCDARLDHVLIKGPTTAGWLYEPARAYRDIDLLIRPSQLRRALRVLKRSQLVTDVSGRPGEMASHSLVCRMPGGVELDLHLALPLMSVARRDVETHLWQALAAHRDFTELLSSQVASLDEAGRALVLVLHFGASNGNDQAAEDMARALELVSDETWVEAAELAYQIGVGAAFVQLLAVARGAEPRSELSPALLALREGRAVDYQLHRWREQGTRAKVASIVGRAVPSRNYLLWIHGGAQPVWRAYVNYWRLQMAKVARAISFRGRS